MKNKVKELRTAAQILSSGFTGVAVLIDRIAELFGTTIEDLYCLKENKAEEDKKYEDL